MLSCSKESIDSPVISNDDQQKTARSILNISYGEDQAQKYDIYLPANRSTAITKVLIFIHGGGWIQGDKNDMEEYIPILAEDHPDYAIVNLNYRLAKLPTRAAFPNQFLDIQRALQHLTEAAVDYGILAEFGLIGVSAGAHLALQFDSVYDNFDQVKLVCSIVGPTDLTDPFFKQNPDFLLALQFLVDENAYPGVSDFAKAVSPAYLVSDKNSATILFYGKEDPLVPVSNGILLQKQLEHAGIENSLTIFNGGHGDWNEHANRNLQLKLSNFINLHLPLEF
ncbi:alpha/beta hydrolase [Antarcticibacterium sp. 1MA-6-2]|uniref:alpha/beta hydrolase n=1 Tax=Antarcticibacterium sp. 1MA-6-2 TaxID=2908210 RepID=UPI001F1CCF62|nr:alpha/beta hydrolase [Antarcticibacterium sp. 1MA-6-2]UJH92055.1 alpha/beta hydrolase [Antarcticibacterium sp. 1MA-6-2]